MNHPGFDVSQWRTRCPISLDLDQRRRSYIGGEIITSPSELVHNEMLRTALRAQVDWGNPEPADVFVFGLGAADKPHLTQVGGTPYLQSVLDWPRIAGEPLSFLGQICFLDSLDITGPLPGDTLLFFANWMGDGYFEDMRMVWRTVEGPEVRVMTEDEIPDGTTTFECHYGAVCRTSMYPNASIRVPANDLNYQGIPITPIIQFEKLCRYQATQISQFPFVIQETPELAGRLLCTLSTIGHAYDCPYPWINQEEPIPLEDVSVECEPEEGDVSDIKRLSLPLSDYSESDELEELQMFDAGCIYCSIDAEERLHWEPQSY